MQEEKPRNKADGSPAGRENVVYKTFEKNFRQKLEGVARKADERKFRVGPGITSKCTYGYGEQENITMQHEKTFGRRKGKHLLEAAHFINGREKKKTRSLGGKDPTDPNREKNEFVKKKREGRPLREGDC